MADVDADGPLISEDELASTQQFIENALDLKLKGNSTTYDFLVRQLSDADGGAQAAAARRRVFLSLPRCISAMAGEPQAFQQLFDALFKFSFLAARAERVAFARFVAHLVSSNTVFVLPTLQMLARCLCRPQQLPPWLTPPPAAPVPAPATAKRIAIGGSFGGIISTAPVSASDNKAPEEPVIDVEARIEQRYAAAHELLQRVLALVPTAANVLFPVVCEHVPHKRLDTAFQVAFLKNVLKLSTYVPGLQERVFALVVDQLVAVDVEIKLDEQEEDVFTMDDFLDDALLPPDSGAQVDEMADKLDEMMLAVFAHIEAVVGASSSVQASTGTADGDLLDVQKAATVFRYLLKVFEHSILNTHRSKYPQFLLFYVCRMDPQFQDVFISQLLATSLDPQVPPVTRHSCGAYLASFLARAKYISVAYIQKALYHLLQWMHGQMDVYDAALQPSSSSFSPLAAEQAALEEHSRGSFQESIYISSLQTVCYLLCFRGLEVAQAPHGYDFLRSLGWQRLLITSTGYCPLAFCQQTVASEFLNFAETFDLISDECIDRVDQAVSSSSTSAFSKNKKKAKTMERSTAPTVASNSSSSSSATTTVLLGQQRQPLETFFPFDPYLLRRSFKYIGPSYLYWKHADPMSSENCDALNAVKAIIKEYEEENGGNDDEREEDDEEEEDEEEDGDEDDGVEDDAEEGGGRDDDDVSMAGSVGAASFKGLSYFEASMARSHGTSVGSSVDGGDYSFDERERELRMAGPASGDRKNHKKNSRTAFDPSPALSASSPPSRLPPLGSANAFTLGGFDDYEDDGF